MDFCGDMKTREPRLIGVSFLGVAMSVCRELPYITLSR